MTGLPLKVYCGRCAYFTDVYQGDYKGNPVLKCSNCNRINAKGAAPTIRPRPQPHKGPSRLQRPLVVREARRFLVANRGPR